jgi:hypothetical protein
MAGGSSRLGGSVTRRAVQAKAVAADKAQVGFTRIMPPGTPSTP